MHLRHPVTAFVAAALTGAALVISLSDRPALLASPATKQAILGDLGSGDRIFLSAEQVRETQDSALWPAAMRSLLRVDQPLHYGEWVWDDHGVPAGKDTVRIDLKTQMLSVARHGHEIGTAVILYGAESHQTPIGRFPILSKRAAYRSVSYDAPMPYALRLTRDGVAIHGSDVQQGRATHGCIGLPLAFARKLFREVRLGDQVLIVRS